MEAVYSNFSEAKEIKENQKKIAERLEVDKWGIPPNMNIFGNQQISWTGDMGFISLIITSMWELWCCVHGFGPKKL